MAKRRSTIVDAHNQLSCLPYAVGHGDEGICLLVQMGSYRILLDCGIKDLSPLLKESNPPDWAFCSHAHVDHAQGLLTFHQAFPKVPIYASEITAKLLALQESELDVGEIPSFCQELPWRSRHSLANDLTVELYPAGHLPGAAIIVLTYNTPQRNYRLLYTGDFFLSNARLVEGVSLDSLKQTAPDIVIIEGSYGTVRHPHRRRQENQLMERISRALGSEENVLLPVPPLGLAQEILMLLRSHHQFTGKDLDIWVDGEIAQVCDIYLELLPHLPASVQNFARHQPLFWDERVRPRMRRYRSQEKNSLSDAPCVVVTEANADLSQYYQNSDSNWAIFVPEHPRVSMTPSRHEILEMADDPRVRVETYLLSQHSDGLGTTQLIHNLRPQHVIFVHGTPNYLANLTSLEELQNRYHLHSPPAGTLVELPIGDTFVQPAAPPDTHHEGEVREREDDVIITLPHAIVEDLHWHNFADTGIIEARWQGEELVLRGVSQQEILSQNSEARMVIDIDCCGTCLFFRNSRCNNPASPLYGFQVTPEGYCPVFERKKSMEQ